MRIGPIELPMRTCWLVALIALGSACDEESSGAARYGSHVVWSDDDTMLLIAERDFAYRGHHETSTARLFLLDPAPGARTVALGEPRNGEVLELYLMMSGGYALADFAGRDGSHDLVQFFLDGQTRIVVPREVDDVLAECDRISAIPSPDATMIGIAYACDPASGSGSEHLIIDAQSSDTIVHLADTDHGQGMWTPEGAYVIAGRGAVSLSWEPGDTTARTIRTPACVWPRTSSSAVAENGQLVMMDDIDEPPYVEYSDERTRHVAFGCT